MATDKKKNETDTNEEEALEASRPIEGDKWEPVREHTEQEQDELIYAEKFGMAWNPADHESFGGADFEREYEDESTYTGQPFRTEGEYEGDDPTATTPPTDEQIEAAVKEKLQYQGQINWIKIEVSVKDGEVTLDGTVGDDHHRGLAVDALASVAGITGIHNRLKVE